MIQNLESLIEDNKKESELALQEATKLNKELKSLNSEIESYNKELSEIESKEKEFLKAGAR